MLCRSWGCLHSSSLPGARKQLGVCCARSLMPRPKPEVIALFIIPKGFLMLDKPRARTGRLCEGFLHSPAFCTQAAVPEPGQIPALLDEGLSRAADSKDHGSCSIHVIFMNRSSRSDGLSRAVLTFDTWSCRSRKASKIGDGMFSSEDEALCPTAHTRPSPQLVNVSTCQNLIHDS